MENKFPLVSILTPCYNGERFLKIYFESIIKQTYTNLELILVNDGSTDDTEKIVEKYRPILKKHGIKFIYLYQENGGQANAINNGLKYVHGKYLVWPDSDDILSEDSIEKRVLFLEKNLRYGFVRSNGYFFDFETKEKQQRISISDNRFHEDIFLDLILENTYCCCGCYMIRMELLKKIYPDLKIYESSAGQNWQILIPFAGKYKCGYIDEDMYFIANREGSHSREKRSLDEMIERYLELKKILNISINHSGRKDKNYEYIVDVKYWKILFKYCMNMGDIDQGKKYYKNLCECNEITNEEIELYLKKVCPIRYKIYAICNLGKRGVRKMVRILFLKK